MMLCSSTIGTWSATARRSSRTAGSEDRRNFGDCGSNPVQVQSGLWRCSLSGRGGGLPGRRHDRLRPSNPSDSLEAVRLAMETKPLLRNFRSSADGLANGPKRPVCRLCRWCKNQDICNTRKPLKKCTFSEAGYPCGIQLTAKKSKPSFDVLIDRDREHA
jgi:hypothetical protein